MSVEWGQSASPLKATVRDGNDDKKINFVAKTLLQG